MRLCDVNVLLAAHRADHQHHEVATRCMDTLRAGPEPVAWSELVLSAVVRIATTSVFTTPSTVAQVMSYVDALLATPGSLVLRPGPRHWALFRCLVESSGARGKLVADAYHAALALEHGCEWVTQDSDFQRFSDLRCCHPARV